MPKRTDISSILIIGAGPIIIGQACEFDYSGTQACKALKDEGYRVILINSNPATIMTDPELADSTYIEPITPEIVEKIIAKEKPDALLPTMGGQTALNCALELQKRGVLAKHGVEMIGATSEAIDKAEDRSLFRKAMDKIGLESPRSKAVNTLSEALEALEFVGLPTIIRPSFTMGGTGGGIAYNKEEFISIVEGGLEASPTTEVLVEESVLGWKEYEMEVVRDKNDNCIIICSIENIDPMGVHTGDSITIAPALTLTDKEYQIMRNASIAVLREIGVETGGSNVQFAVNPDTGRLVVIEMNPRVSRSSALASKATGFPIAKVAAKLAVGFTLDELENDITGGATPVSFEPTIDYVVTKIPRFAFEKFAGSDTTLTTSMKSVGESMAIGRTFCESLQKALRSLETGLNGLNEIEIFGLDQGDDKNAIRAALGTPTPDRLLKVAQAMRLGFSQEEIFQYCRIDPWFLDQIKSIITMEEKVKQHGLPQDKENLLLLKSMGFSDTRLAQLAKCSADDVLKLRNDIDVHPVYKRIDTCAAEFKSPTAYMYSTYETASGLAGFDESDISDREKVVILGGGPNRIGQGIEFDYCCCHAAYALSDAGYETIMVNCNPETVSTDYDTSDRLYFEPLTAEDVLAILRLEQSKGKLKGVIVQFGGQTPLNLANAIEQAGIPILGTSPKAIDLAEDRDSFKNLLENLDLKQPHNAIAHSIEECHACIKQIGFPVVVRPSNVLGGRAMEIIRDVDGFEIYMRDKIGELVPQEQRLGSERDPLKQIDNILKDNPLLFDGYLSNATEVDVDCVADDENQVVCGILEHIEEAGIHSGDSACSLPPYSLSQQTIDELTKQAKALAKALNVRGLMNVQFAISGDDIFVLEVNPRASRTVPFVAKVIGSPIAAIASRVMAGEALTEFKINPAPKDRIAVKESVFPFARFPGVDTVLGPEMRSTGEIMGIDSDFSAAFAKSQLGGGTKVPVSGTAFFSVKDEDKEQILKSVKLLQEFGFKIIATSGTQRYLIENRIDCQKINKVLEGRPHIVDAIKNGDVHLIVNTTEGKQALVDSKSLRQAALMNKVPYYTTLSGGLAAIEGIKAMNMGTLDVNSIQNYIQQAS